MGSLIDKKVLITAGGQGIGASMARSFLQAGSQVVVHYFSSAPTLPGEADGYHRLRSRQADLRNRGEAQALVAYAAETLGGIDILINNAGSLIARKWLGEIDPDFYQQSLDLNLGSMLWVTQAAQPHLVAAGRKEGASIVNLASLAGRKGGHAGSLLYATTKGAVLTLTRALAAELGPQGVRVNAVAPGLILGTSFHNTHTTRESAEATIRTIPLGRAGTPEEVARLVLYLASEYDGFIHGATVDVNGGAYMA